MYSLFASTSHRYSLFASTSHRYSLFASTSHRYSLFSKVTWLFGQEKVWPPWLGILHLLKTQELVAAEASSWKLLLLSCCKQIARRSLAMLLSLSTEYHNFVSWAANKNSVQTTWLRELLLELHLSKVDDNRPFLEYSSTSATLKTFSNPTFHH